MSALEDHHVLEISPDPTQHLRLKWQEDQVERALLTLITACNRASQEFADRSTQLSLALEGYESRQAAQADLVTFLMGFPFDAIKYLAHLNQETEFGKTGDWTEHVRRFIADYDRFERNRHRPRREITYASK